MAWLIRALCLFLGIWIGFGIDQLRIGQDENRPQHTVAVAIDQPLNKLPNSHSAFDFEKAVKQAVREEMSVQLASLKHPPQNCVQTTTTVNEGGRQASAEKIEAAYNAANHNLDEVIAAGGFDFASARDFLEHINELPADKAFELRLRHVRAINEGLSSAILPEQALMMK